MTSFSYLLITAEHHGQRSLLRLRGELDAGNQLDLRRAIDAVLDHRDPRCVVLDISALGFTDCAGLSAMVWAHKCLAERGRDLIITGAPPAVRRLMRLTALDTYFNLRAPQPSRGAGHCRAAGTLRQVARGFRRLPPAR